MTSFLTFRIGDKVKVVAENYVDVTSGRVQTVPHSGESGVITLISDDPDIPFPYTVEFSKYVSNCYAEHELLFDGNGNPEIKEVFFD